MTDRPSVMVAMSGGVDSSVAAALLVDRGYDVTGVTLKLWAGADGTPPTSGCCTAADASDARSVASLLGIPYYVFDYQDEFRAGVVDPVIAGYASGVTPNPCIECNRLIKLALLRERASLLGCEFIATGHHARVMTTNGRPRLLRGCDRAKDQSYVLYMLDEISLRSLLLPIGEMTKTQVRATARRLGLRTAEKDESQDVCFVGDGGMRAFLETELADRLVAGEVLDRAGATVGRHRGAALFTIGQRRGVGVSAAGRRFVTAVDPASGTVRVGSRAELESRVVEADGVSWVSGLPPEDDSQVMVQIRYASDPLPGRVFSTSQGSMRLELDQSAWAVAPGQAAVCYRGDEVIGGGTIRRSEPDATATG